MFLPVVLIAVHLVRNDDFVRVVLVNLAVMAS